MSAPTPTPAHPIIANLIAFIEKEITAALGNPALLALLQALLTSLLAGVKSGNHEAVLTDAGGTPFGPFISLVVSFLQAHPELVADFESALQDLISQYFPAAG